MIPEMESPALGVRGNPEGDFAAGKIEPDNNNSHLLKQAGFQIEHAISWRKVHGGGTA
jgi:hypothetical protein